MALVTSAAASLKNTWGFSPQSIPGLQLWLDAADQNTLFQNTAGTTPVTAAGQQVQFWRDKSGNGRNATSSDTAMTYNTTGIGKPSISFSGSQALGFQVNVPVTDSTYFFVVNNAGSPDDTRIYNAHTGTSNRKQNWWFNAYRTQMDYAGRPGINGSTNTNGLTLIMTRQDTSSTGLLAGWQNGTSIGTNTTAAAIGETFTSFALGTANLSGIFPMIGFIAETIVYNSVLTTAQRQQVEGYLAAKWGLQANLPATHPYSATNIIPFNRPFYPTDISGCTLWMDAADRSSMTFSSGSNISRWKDKSGQGNDFTVTEGTPVLSTTTIGNPGVFLPALSQMQSVSNAAENGAASRTSFFVADTPGGGGKQTQMGTGQINSTGAVWGFHFDRMGTTTPTSNFMFSPYTWGNDIFFATTPLSALTTSTNIGFGAYNSNTTTMTGNLNFSNSDSNKTITPNTAAGPWWMGDRPNGGFTTGTGGTTAGNSWICEFIQYSGVLTTQQRQQVESYLSWKWNTTTSLPFPAGHPGKLLPAFSTNFTPKSISGCQLWMDGADRSSMVFSGTTVTTWNDKSGNGLHGTATGTPTYTANALNGLGAPALNSNANFFKTPTFIISPTVGTPSIFMIMNQTAWGSGNSDFFQSTNSWQRLDFFGQGNAFNVAVTMNNAGPTVISATTTSNNPTLLSFVVNTASGGVGFANGTFTSTVGTAGGLLVQTDTYSIGGGPGFIGFIYELIVFNNTVSTSQRQQVEGYLAWKWGLQRSLPSTHAYAKFSP